MSFQKYHKLQQVTLVLFSQFKKNLYIFSKKFSGLQLINRRIRKFFMTADLVCLAKFLKPSVKQINLH